MFRISYISILLLFLVGCNNQQREPKQDVKPVSYTVYTLNFIDEAYCKSCISSDFTVAISMKTILKSEHLLVDCKEEKEVKRLFQLLRKAKSKSIKATPTDNRFVVSFQLTNGRKDVYSLITDNEWLLNDSIVVTPKQEILEIIRMQNKLGDMTDYKYVSKLPIEFLEAEK